MLGMNNARSISIPQNYKYKVLSDESRFWMQAIHSWMNVIERLLQEAGEIKASPEVTAEVARTAGELSLLAERLNPLLVKIEQHNNESRAGNEIEWRTAHRSLHQQVLEEGNVFRDLLTEMFTLEESAYTRFLS
jgi:uncharacterized protein with von Willebrand factor type A (vWA) domain